MQADSSKKKLPCHIFQLQNELGFLVGGCCHSSHQHLWPSWWDWLNAISINTSTFYVYLLHTVLHRRRSKTTLRFLKLLMSIRQQKVREPKNQVPCQSNIACNVYQELQNLLFCREISFVTIYRILSILFLPKTHVCWNQKQVYNATLKNNNLLQKFANSALFYILLNNFVRDLFGSLQMLHWCPS